ncbi:E3 SUMO-protein ligase ZBED1-like [Prorops nasuta]|uniref:E3 SUMO-protein ligase ZBED1-like n=1 Tax=Prorops nasuta TaxID=863751 RepID=UPI0034CFEF44
MSQEKSEDRATASLDFDYSYPTVRTGAGAIALYKRARRVVAEIDRERRLVNSGLFFVFEKSGSECGIGEPEILVPLKTLIWKYFVNFPNGGKCKICQQEIKTSGNTTNLKLHLKRQYPTVELGNHDTTCNERILRETQICNIFDNNERRSIDDPDDPNLCPVDACSSASVTTPSTSTSLDMQCSSPTLSCKQPRIDNTIYKQISFKDNLPFSIVEKEGFTLFMESIVPLYKIPKRKTITQLIDEKYELLSNIIKNQLKKISHLSLTTDIWTEPLNTKSYIGLTGHYIQDDSHKSVTIGVTALNDRHSSSNIENWLKEIFKDGSNIKKAIKDAFGTEKHLSCFAHSLNLISAKVIESNNINMRVKQIKSIVTYFKKSVIAADKLRDISELKLIQSVETRWDSTYNMLSRFVELSNKIGSILLELLHAPSMITAAEFQTAKEFVSLLEPFENATKIVSGENYLTASKVISIINTLRISLKEKIPETEIGTEMKELLLEKFEQRFANIENEMILAICTILDPRFKIIHFNNDSACTNCINHISNALNEERSSDVQENKIPEDFKYYLTQTPVEMTTCPIKFWRSNNSALCRLAEKYLAVIATSVPCERIFSKCGQILTENRNRLTAEHLQHLLFLGSLSKDDWNVYYQRGIRDTTQ